MTQRDLLPAELPDDLLDHLEEPEIRARWPRDLVAMLDVVADALRLHLSEEQTRQLATIAVHALARYHGGRMFYLPKGEQLEQAIRDKQMWDRYDGRRDSIHRFVAEFALTEQQVYTILRRQRALHVQRVQHSLPLDH